MDDDRIVSFDHCVKKMTGGTLVPGRAAPFREGTTHSARLSLKNAVYRHNNGPTFAVDDDRRNIDIGRGSNMTHSNIDN